ncbi:hypothetical protein OJ997_26655 [Solirubrobacter phytolaccae]|uniref:Uncharacterized protein n=1 Tax=Solirubrobacter phytolaccae TaxID=1404360 RepID=A0A9X3ND52_9ACTN|nr:hypothetical protein [Solirubrobacter phytolaccae]MDA0183916.1 hypothetical protein [Solirubrobacter phytolaccae]
MNDLDRYLDDLGDRLADAKAPRRRWPALAAAGAAALIAALVGSLIGGPGGSERRPVVIGPVDALAKARAALAVADGEMLHLRLQNLEPDLPKGANAVKAIRSGTQEQWSASDPQRWRIKTTDGVGEVVESAYAAGVNSHYTANDDRLVRVGGYRDGIPQVRMPSLFGQGGGDPDTDLRAALDKGRLTDTGEVRVDGRTVRRLKSDQDLFVLIYDVDPQTFAPVGGSRAYYMPPRKPGGKRRWAGTFAFTVDVFERVPADENALTITPGADTKIVTCRVKSPKKPRPLIGCRTS